MTSVELINLYIRSSAWSLVRIFFMVILYIYGGVWMKAFIIWFQKVWRYFFFCFFFLEGSSLVEGGGAGENVKAWSGKKAERHDLREWKLSGSAPVPAGRVQKVSILRKKLKLSDSQTGVNCYGHGRFHCITILWRTSDSLILWKFVAWSTMIQTDLGAFTVLR